MPATEPSIEILGDGPTTFEVLTFDTSGADRTVLFAPGRGGSPKRHMPLLQAMADAGLSVIAPELGLLRAQYPAVSDLSERARKLRLSLDELSPDGNAKIGIGHSIGATLLLGLAGATLWTRARENLSETDPISFHRLVLLAPATDFVDAPDTLTGVSTNAVLWAGAADTFVPVSKVAGLRDRIQQNGRAELRVAEGAGHFSFMNELPPNVEEVHPDRETFLRRLAAEIIADISAAH